jgi:hypothetical protein
MMEIQCKTIDRFWRLLSVFLLAVLCGCGSREQLGDVTGQITFQGKPVTKAVIHFSNPTKGIFIAAESNAMGQYVVEMAKGRGLPAGTYQVSISPASPVPTKAVPATGPLPKSIKAPESPDIPPKYRDSKTSGLTLTVVDGQNCFDVKMTL